jgi:hypothetical protein
MAVVVESGTFPLQALRSKYRALHEKLQRLTEPNARRPDRRQAPPPTQLLEGFLGQHAP